MKNILIITALFLASNIDVYAKKCYQSKKWNGQTDPITNVTTYSRVSEGDPIVSGEITTYTILCWTPGTLSCTFKDGTPGIVISGTTMDYAAVDQYVLAQIAMGNQSGNILADNGVDELTWDATNVDDYEFTVCFDL